VRWLGGGTGAGKSTIARRLAGQHDMVVYDSDATLREHARRSDPATDPLLHAFLAMDMDERWANRSPEMMLRTFHGFAGEGFHRIVEDLLTLPTDRMILAEGFRLLPDFVAPLLSDRHQGVWLIPTPSLRRAAFDARGFTWEIPNRTNDPERALANLLERDALFTRQVGRVARKLGLPLLTLDIGVSVDEATERVRASFRLGEPHPAAP
jgi:2-phosphoglycerate kinase